MCRFPTKAKEIGLVAYSQRHGLSDEHSKDSVGTIQSRNQFNQAYTKFDLRDVCMDSIWLYI